MKRSTILMTAIGSWVLALAILFVIVTPAFAADAPPAKPAITVTVTTPAPVTPAKPAAPVKPTEMVVPAVVAPITPAVPAAPATPTETPAAEPEVAKPEVPLPTSASPFIDAIRSRQWGPIVGLILMVIVWVLTTFVWSSIPKSWIPYLSGACGMVVQVSSELIGNVHWTAALIDGLILGAAASGFWSMIGKHTLGKVPSKKKA